MKYLAHISEDKTREQLLIDHLRGTAELAAIFAKEFGCEKLAYCTGMLHDIGKYSNAFQERIRGGTHKVDHATAGAKLCCEKGGLYSFLGYCIAGHHAGLADTGKGSDSSISASFSGRMKKRLEDYLAYQREVEIPNIDPNEITHLVVQTPGFTFSFLIRMLYSCLVDADYLDTEEFMKNGQNKRYEGEGILKLYHKLEKYISKWLTNTEQNTLNGRRTEILSNCIRMGEKKRGLFQLTVPTGGGKTVASLAFALNHAVANQMRRIIYVIPYTSIIEQNAEVFRTILGKENVLEHHSGVDYDSAEELHPMQLAAENWDMPVVVTTNVQFFESIFSNRSSQCRKLHNITNSVIIFDEAQMLPTDYLLPCIKVMEELVKNYQSSIVLCTATQPSLQNFFSKACEIEELCPHVKEQFAFFKRTSISSIGTITKDRLVEHLRKEKQALCILNTKLEAKEVYELFAGTGVYHLSTLMYPMHRKAILHKVRDLLSGGEKCILISTSLVEAGVDLDFYAVYRQMAGVDSMIQAAGRCNREGKNSANHCNTYIFQLEGAGKVSSQEQQIDTAKMVMEEYEDLASMNAIESYFQWLYGLRKEGLDKKRILEQVEASGFHFLEIAKQFTLIEQATKTIFIPVDERAKELLEELKIKGFTKQSIRKASQYCVNVYENVFHKLHAAGRIQPIPKVSQNDFYVLYDVESYSMETGLKTDIRLGVDCWL